MSINKQERNQRFIQTINALSDDRAIIAKKLRYSKSYLDQLMIQFRNVSDTIILKLSKCYPQINYDWIMTGEGEMFRPKSELREFEFQTVTIQFSENMKVLREVEGMTTGEFAQILNLYEGKVIDMEAGRVGPSLSLLMDLRKLFNIRIDDMMFTDVSGVNFEKAHLSYTDEVRAKDLEEVLEEVKREIQEIRQQVDSLKNK